MIVSYSIISAVVLLCGYLVYKIFLADKHQHAFNRMVILSLYVLSLILPFFVIWWLGDLSSIYRSGSGNAQGIGLLAIDPNDLQGGNAMMTSSHLKGLSATTVTLITVGYLAGLAVLLLYSLAGAVTLYRYMSRGEEMTVDGYRLKIIDRQDISPFSWRQSVVISRKDLEESGDMILTHECRHIKLRHWSDMVLAQIVICIQWFNPAAWALRRELKVIHEYQADEAVLESGADPKEYQMLLVRKAAGPHLQIFADGLSHSKLKKRVTMMYKQKTSFAHRLGALLIVPAVAAGCALTAIPSVAGVLESFAETPAVSEAQAPAAKDREVYTAVEEMAEFPGGMTELMKFLSSNIRYPEEAFKQDIQGRVIVRFVVEKDGSIGDISILKGVDPMLDKEALRVVEEMPKWKPGKVKGEPVASFFNLPVSFKITSTGKEDTPKTTENK